MNVIDVRPWDRYSYEGRMARAIVVERNTPFDGVHTVRVLQRDENADLLDGFVKVELELRLSDSERDELVRALQA